jgi:glutamate racemase
MARLKSNRPIGVFDSGVGGLTVLREISRQLPAEPLVYLGDTARLPYGTKSAQTVERYALQAAHHLLALDIKMLVVACNTATAFALPRLQSELEIPVIGVVEPGATAAVAATRGTVGVIATEGTVRSGAYGAAIRRLRPEVTVIEQPCPLFVPLAEEGWANTRVALEVAEIYLKPLVDSSIDTLVLGCTHYPILKNTIETVVGESIAIVDSAETTGEAVGKELRARHLVSPGRDGQPHHFLITDAEERFRRVATEFLEDPIESVELIALG